jgi:hypothetical protein
MLIDVKPRGKIGRVAGTNARLRSSLQSLVDGEVANIRTWLHLAAQRIPKVNADGEVLRDNQGSVVWVNKPDPLGAIKTIAELAEFVVPKLSRTEATVAAKIEHGVDISSMNARELEARLLTALGLNEGNVVDVEHVMVEPVPEWMKNASD